jgi:predicted metal-dependent HD superfamily phosphohydrolase
MLQETFTTLAAQYVPDTHLIADCWNELEKNYSGKGRHYHTLGHLQNLLEELQNIQPHIHDWNTILFTLFYHDAIYNAQKSDNEEKSAALAETRLQSLSVPSQLINHCKSQILATKKHLPDQDEDTNYFTDADLSILGQPWDIYNRYAQNVRKEYRIYPDLIYKPGRKKVLQHFLNMERIYKTGEFHKKYEVTAKQNLQKEFDCY